MNLRILLINPPRVDGYPVVREERFEHKDIGSVYPPLSLLYMAAVLERDEKNRVSHRGRAFRELRDEFDKVLIWIRQQMPVPATFVCAQHKPDG